MGLGLGIDTGSTFVDAAMMDLDQRRLLSWTKSPMDPRDLAGSIGEAVGSLLRKGRFDPLQVRLVGISTTLAIDALLEGRGCRVGLIGIGWDHERPQDLGADRWAFVKGGHDGRGRELHPLDLDALKEEVVGMRGEVEAFVISSTFSMQHPEHEERGRTLIDRLTGSPVVVAHEFSRELGVVERSVTAVLNARLLPIITDFLDRIEGSLGRSGIRGKVMVLRGDGSAMPVDVARRRPVETVLSGPAASLLGGVRLSGLDNCLVVDMGGTSTDLVFIDDGFPRISREGARVAGWDTRVRSMEVTTVALGGESEIISDLQGGVRIGPRRVIPLALAGEEEPGLPRMIMERQRTDFLVQARSEGPRQAKDRRVYDKVGELGLCDVEQVRDALLDLYQVRETVANLVHEGYLLTTGLTPTDIFNLEGLYRVGDLSSSRAGVVHFLEGTCTTVGAFCARLMHRLVGRLAEEVVRKVLREEVGDLPTGQGTDLLVQMLAGERSPGTFQLRLTLDRPIVGLGGPARLVVPSLHDLLGAEVVIPDGHQVGNAVGAVSGRISETVTLRIQPLSDGQFQLVTPFGSELEFWKVEEALDRAKWMAEDHVRGQAEGAGAKDVRLRVDVRELRSWDEEGMDHVDWIEVTARATGEPR
ncbi:MAG: hydantoinase/oxoprolinase family protein [Methanomassiliicoccales archaeon]|nr:hydantoinase/oxoprolinase family protein [Methanomassiliicoccales archaeon]